MHLGRIGVALGANHAGGDDTGHRGPHAIDTLDRQADIGQRVSDRIDVIGQWCQFAEPGVNDLHVRTAR